ncbi:MAG: penicillin-binding protein 2 [Armatimonadetes bacterium]|nr:penicillin-binding protein 2 [Fimbriimonadia bacterium ATM]NOG92293.1 penicillin-binding protein 2 [Armatimonadota bacterium]
MAHASRKRLTRTDWHGRAAIALVVLGFALVSWNQLKKQWLQRESILSAAAEVHRLVVSQVLPAKRGSIVSSDGRVLASTGTAYRFGVKPGKVPESPAFYAALARATGIPASEIMDRVTSSTGVTEWVVDLSESQVREFQQAKADYGADGVWLTLAKEREYPFRDVLAGLLGSYKDGKARFGLDKGLDSVLAGESGKVVGMIDRSGNFLPWLIDERDSKPAVNGQDVVLTIDSDIQRAAYQALKRSFVSNKAANGIAIVMDPKTGDLLAVATLPSFEPDRVDRELALALSGKRTSPEINPAVGLVFEPGSTFKVLTVALSMDNGVIKPGEKVYCSGQKSFSGIEMGCTGSHGRKAHGAVTKETCIEASCNVAAATWAVRLGYDKFKSFLDRSRILEKPNLFLSPSPKGMFRTNEVNKVIQMANIGFGQSINLSPVMLASAFASIANGGVSMKPRVVKSIGEKEQPPEIQARLFKPATAREMLKMMQAVIQGPRGTATSLAIPGYRLAGKTGTAQKPDPQTGVMQSGRYVSSFVGYVPADNPRAVVLVILDDPRGGQYYGAAVAGPVFKDIAAYLLKRWHIPPAHKPTKNATATSR